MEDNVMEFPASDITSEMDADNAISSFAESVTELAVDAFQVGNDAVVSLVGNIDGNMVRVTVSIDYAHDA